MNKSKKVYLLLAVLLFLTEVFIALFVDDRIVRPYGGDFLVVILLYCFLKIFWDANVKTVAFSVLIFSYVIEVSQYFKLVNRIGLGHSKLAKVVLGNSFAWSDLLAYTLGILLVLIVEKRLADQVKTAAKKPL